MQITMAALVHNNFSVIHRIVHLSLLLLLFFLLLFLSFFVLLMEEGKMSDKRRGYACKQTTTDLIWEKRLIHPDVR